MDEFGVWMFESVHSTYNIHVDGQICGNNMQMLRYLKMKDPQNLL